VVNETGTTILGAACWLEQGLLNRSGVACPPSADAKSAAVIYKGPTAHELVCPIQPYDKQDVAVDI